MTNRSILIECPLCHGEGSLEYLWGFDPKTDDPVGLREECGSRATAA
jgi:hypothetical protein